MGLRFPEKLRAGRRADGDASVQGGGDVVRDAPSIATKANGGLLCTAGRRGAWNKVVGGGRGEQGSPLRLEHEAAGEQGLETDREARPVRAVQVLERADDQVRAVRRNRSVAGIDLEVPSLDALELEGRPSAAPSTSKPGPRLPEEAGAGRCDRASSRVRTVHVGGAYRRDPR